MKRTKRTYFAFTFLVFIFLFSTSCKKEEGIEVNYSVVNLNEDMNVQKIIFINSTLGYACGGKKGQSGVIYKSLDGGNSWKKIYANSNECVYDVSFANDTLGFACGENLLLLKTIDGGLNWNKYEYPSLPPSGFIGTLRSISIVNATSIYVAGGLAFESGITYKTFDGGGFWIYNNFENELRNVHFTDKYTGYYAGYGIILKTVDSAKNFYPLPIQNDFFTSLSFVDKSSAFACGYNGGIYITADEGNSWEERYKGSSTHQSHFNYISNLNSSLCYAVGNNGLIVFTENEVDWNTIKKFTDDNLFSICFKDDKIFISGQGGNIYSINRKP